MCTFLGVGEKKVWPTETNTLPKFSRFPQVSGKKTDKKIKSTRTKEKQKEFLNMRRYYQ